MGTIPGSITPIIGGTSTPHQSGTSTVPYIITTTTPGSGISVGNVSYPYVSSGISLPPTYDIVECEKVTCKDIIIDNHKLSKILEMLPLTSLPEGLDMSNVTIADAVGSWYNALENLKQKHKQLLTIKALCEKQKE